MQDLALGPRKIRYRNRKSPGSSGSTALGSIHFSPFLQYGPVDQPNFVLMLLKVARSYQDVKRNFQPGDILVQKLSGPTAMDPLRHYNQKINITILLHFSPGR